MSDVSSSLYISSLIIGWNYPNRFHSKLAHYKASMRLHIELYLLYSHMSVQQHRHLQHQLHQLHHQQRTSSSLLTTNLYTHHPIIYSSLPKKEKHIASSGLGELHLPGLYIIDSPTRGHPWKLKKGDHTLIWDDNSFRSGWNKLDSETVCATSVNSFMNRLQRMWLKDEFVVAH